MLTCWALALSIAVTPAADEAAVAEPPHVDAPSEASDGPCPPCPECPAAGDDDEKTTAQTIDRSARTKCLKKGTRAEKKACRKARMAHWRSYPHRGVIAEVNGGIGGCVGAICRDNLDTGTGGGVGAFVGGNLFGFAEIGASVAWRGMSIRDGGNPLSDHGLDPTGFANAAAGRDDDPDAIATELEALDVGKGSARMLFAGAEARIHMLPAGRGSLYLGSGIGFARWRALYSASGGDVDLRLASIGVPVVLGGGFYIKRFLIVNLQLRYLFTSPRRYTLRSPAFDGDAFRDGLREWDAVTLDKAGAAPQFLGLLLGLKFRV
jgi:hypothetical protein